MTTYIANRISNKRNILFPDKIVFSETYIEYYKAAIIGYHKTIVSFNNIASFTFDVGVLFIDIKIETKGGEILYIKGFNRGDLLNLQKEFSNI